MRSFGGVVQLLGNHSYRLTILQAANPIVTMKGIAVEKMLGKPTTVFQFS